MITLYHGSSSIVKSPIANVGRRNLDFGRGFYMTRLYDQVIDTIEDFENGRITAEQALDQLRFKQPNNQICIRDQIIIDKYLRFVKSQKTN